MTEEELAFVRDQFAAEFGQSVVDGKSFTMEYTTRGDRPAVELDYGMGSFAREFKVPPMRYPPPPPGARRPPPAARRPPATHAGTNMQQPRTSSAHACAAFLHVP